MQCPDYHYSDVGIVMAKILCECGKRYVSGGGASFSCAVCGRRLQVGSIASLPQYHPSQTEVKQHGPGTELKALLAELGLHPASGCDCNARAAQMDAWGAAGCREHRDEIIAWLGEQAKRASWTDAVNVAWRTGIWSLGGLVDESIRLAEKRQASSVSNV